MRPNVQMYIQTVQRTVEIERQIAKDHNSLDTFKKRVGVLFYKRISANVSA